MRGASPDPQGEFEYLDFEAIRGAVERSPERFPGLGPLELVRCTLVI
jgi:hypothetical protein